MRLRWKPSPQVVHSIGFVGSGGGGGTAREGFRDGPGVGAGDAETDASADSVPGPNVLSLASVRSALSSSSLDATDARSRSDSLSELAASIACSFAVVRLSSSCVSSIYSRGGLGASGGGGGIFGEGVVRGAPSWS